MFTTYIYQPFFNILVGIYWVLGRISPELMDMGIAVIIFAIFVRILTLPLTIAGERSEEEKREIVDKVEEAKRTYSSDPIKLKEVTKKILKANKRVVISTYVNLAIQLGIILMLYRIFKTGLEGRDYYLLYDFMPDIDHVNLMFLGKYDLSQANATLNLLQSAMILIVELLTALRSPFPLSRKDIALTQLILPVGSYIIFMGLPAGKKVFIITSLMFSALYSSVRIVQSWVSKLSSRLTPPMKPESEELLSGDGST